MSKEKKIALTPMSEIKTLHQLMWEVAKVELYLHMLVKRAPDQYRDDVNDLAGQWKTLDELMERYPDDVEIDND